MADLVSDLIDIKKVTAFLIGDIHFKPRLHKEGLSLINACVEQATKASPDFIVCLGDVLDSHETAKVQCYNLAHDLLKRLRKIAHVYVLMGNHDLMDQNQFQTKNHFFNPFKEWKNVTIVDKAIQVYYGLFFNFVFCPYVPPGSFVEALDSIKDKGWRDSDCIFAHQEFQGCVMGQTKSKKGDVWSEDRPMVISGHIHDSQTLGKVHYIGSATQHAFGERDDKRVWIITFSDEDEPEIQKIDLGLKKKKIIEIPIAEAYNFDFDILEKYFVNLKLKGNSEEFRVFRKHPIYNELRKKGVKVAFNPIIDISKKNLKHNASNFEVVLREILKTKNKDVVNLYEELFNSTKRNVEPVEDGIELVFVTD